MYGFKSVLVFNYVNNMFYVFIDRNVRVCMWILCIKCYINCVMLFVFEIKMIEIMSYLFFSMLCYC